MGLNSKIQWTNEMTEKLVTAYNSGLKQKEIAKLLGMSWGACKNRLVALGVFKPYDNVQKMRSLSKIREYTDTTDMLIAQMIMEGYTIPYIAKFLDRDKQDLENHIEGNKLTIQIWQRYLLQQHKQFYAKRKEVTL